MVGLRDSAAPVPEHEADRPLAGRVAITSIAQVGTMAAGGIVAAIIGIRFGVTDRTDGLFAAYSLYGLLLMIAQSLRLTMVPRLAQAGADGRFSDGVGSVAMIAAASAIVLVGLGDQIATLLVGTGAAHDVARDSLAIFWIAASGQVMAGYHAAQLAADGRFVVTAVGYLTGSLLPVIALATWPSPGILLVPAVIAAGSLTTALILVVAVWRGRPATRRPTLRGALTTAGQMVAGALGSVMWQVALIVSLGFAARIGVGAVTIYSYGFFASGLIVAATSGSIAMVIAGPVTADWDRRDPRPLEPALLGVVRTSTILAVPLLGIAVLVADDVVRLVLGSALTGHEIGELRDVFLAFSGLIIAASVSPVAALAVYARERYYAIAAIELTALTAHIGATAIVAQLDSLVALALTASCTAWVIVLAAVRFVWAEHTRPLFGRLFRTIAAPVALAAAIYLPLQLLAAETGSVAVAVAGAVAGTLVFVLLASRLLPAYWSPVAGALGSLVRR